MKQITSPSLGLLDQRYVLITGSTMTGPLTLSSIIATSNSLSIKPTTNATTAIQLQNAAGTSILNVDTTNGRVGIGTTGPTAKLHLPASTATANTASLKITSGVVATTPVSGNIESDGTHLYWTDSGGTRRQLDNA